MLDSIRTFLGTRVDNSPLVLFRMFFGLLAAAESFGAIATGWVHETFVEPDFTFTVIGFEWLQPLSGDGMIYYFIIMGTAGLLMMLGLFYRASSFIFFAMWTTVYLMQKSHYNNHYYLLILLGLVMFLLPAHKSKSLDAKWGLTVPSDTCLRVCHWFFIIQMLIVYVWASINKMHLDWVQIKPLGVWFQWKADYWLIGPLLTKEWMQYFVAWGGILYDGTIVFLFLFPKTRKLAFGLSVFFNLFNSFVFHIGIFPYLMIALSLFFFPPETIRKIFFPRKKAVYPIRQKLSLAWTWVLIVYFTWQVMMPLRRHLFEGNTSWTEQAHRLSWRMMLRVKTGKLSYTVKDKVTGEETRIRPTRYVSRSQYSSMKGMPDMIWQMAQRIKKEYADDGKDVAVYANASVSLNGDPRKQLIDPDVDLASVPWEPWKHSPWILTYTTND